MGKNQQHKQMQRGRHGPEEGENPAATAAVGEEGADVSFHTPAWHAARIAALTVERIPYEDWKKKQKEEEKVRQAADEDEERQMREYRAQLDADRASRLEAGSSQAGKKLGTKEQGIKKHKSDKKHKKHKSEKKEKRSKKSKKRRDSSSSPSSDTGRPAQPEIAAGPVRLSDYLWK